MPGLYAELILGKYIIISLAGAEFAILFSRDLQHSEILPRAPAAVPVAAGFYQVLGPDLVKVMGESSTLDLGARPQDAQIIKRQLLFVP